MLIQKRPLTTGDHSTSASTGVNEPYRGSRSGADSLRRWVWLPIPFFLIAILLLKITGDGQAFEPPFLLGVLNFVFISTIMLLISIMAARSYSLSPSLPVLFLGCGSFCFGTVSLIAPVIIETGSINTALTIYNTVVLITGVCMLLSGLSVRIEGGGDPSRGTMVVFTAYFLLLTLIVLLSMAALHGLTPTFFIQGEGGTPLRQIVLGYAMGAFALAGAIIALGGRDRLKVFSVWYGSGLALIACGLFGVLISEVVGSALGWTGRLAQYCGSLYIFIAIIHITRRDRRWQLTLTGALAESEERFRLAAAAADLGAYSVDYVSGTQDFSREFLSIYGLGPEETLPLEEGIPGAVHPEDRPRLLEQISERRSGRQPREFKDEHRIIRPDGEVRWVLVSGRMRFGPDGYATGVNGIIQDITKRKRAEEALVYSERQLRAVMDNLVALVGVLTPDGMLIEANRTALELAGISAEEVVGKPFDQTYWWSWSPAGRQRLREAIKSAAKGQASRYDAEIRIAGNGLMLIDFMLAPLYDEQGRVKYLIPSAFDITARKRAAEERDRLIADLEAANRELEGFTYSVSHDLRAPIRHMNSFAHLLRQQVWEELDGQSRAYLTKVLQSSARMATLVDELLEFSRMRRTPLQEKEVNLNRLVTETLKSFREENEGRDISWKIDQLPTVLGDESMLQLVFWNLISNAVKFSQHRSPAVIEIGCTEEFQEHVIFVKDNGIGFDMLYHDKLFGIFERLHSYKEIEGTGIGLANVARIIERHGGRVWAEGKVDEGAVLYIALPLEKVKSDGQS